MLKIHLGAQQSCLINATPVPFLLGLVEEFVAFLLVSLLLCLLCGVALGARRFFKYHGVLPEKP